MADRRPVHVRREASPEEQRTGRWPGARGILLLRLQASRHAYLRQKVPPMMGVIWYIPVKHIAILRNHLAAVRVGLISLLKRSETYYNRATHERVSKRHGLGSPRRGRTPQGDAEMKAPQMATGARRYNLVLPQKLCDEMQRRAAEWHATGLEVLRQCIRLGLVVAPTAQVPLQPPYVVYMSSLSPPGLYSVSI